MSFKERLLDQEGMLRARVIVCFLCLIWLLLVLEILGFFCLCKGWMMGLFFLTLCVSIFGSYDQYNSTTQRYEDKSKHPAVRFAFVTLIAIIVISVIVQHIRHV